MGAEPQEEGEKSVGSTQKSLTFSSTHMMQQGYFLFHPARVSVGWQLFWDVGKAKPFVHYTETHTLTPDGLFTWLWYIYTFLYDSTGRTNHINATSGKAFLLFQGLNLPSKPRSDIWLFRLPLHQGETNLRTHTCAYTYTRTCTLIVNFHSRIYWVVNKNLIVCQV